MNGVYADYEGALRLGGQRVRFRSTAEARRCGLSMIHQEMSLIPALSVVENIFLGRERTRFGGWPDPAAERMQAAAALGRLGLELDLDQPVERLSIAVRQMVEIAKGLAFDARIVVMDEPTSALNRTEADRLFLAIEDLRRSGCGIVYITHKMEEIYRLADRITVLRDGRLVGTAARADLPREELIRRMVGRDLNRQFPSRAAVRCDAPARLSVESLSLCGAYGRSRPRVRNVTFQVRRGEIVGLAGLEGAGNHELLHALFGDFGSNVSGRVTLDGQVFRLDQPVAELSGGNQQKVVLGKWLATDPRVLLLDEPTRGVDVGAKQEIYALMNAWAARGLSILLITSELPELLAMADRCSTRTDRSSRAALTSPCCATSRGRLFWPAG